jgi:hypothetical protein
MDWKKLLRPIEEGSKSVTRLIRRIPAPEPSLEELASPLQKAIKEELLIKHDIGYNDTCVNCGRQRGVDARLMTACEESTDPEPWLKEMHGELVDTRKELADTRTELVKAKEYYTPQNRMKWAVYGAAASGGASLAIIAVRYATEWAINNLPSIVPLLLPLIG